MRVEVPELFRGVPFKEHLRPQFIICPAAENEPCIPGSVDLKLSSRCAHVAIGKHPETAFESDPVSLHGALHDNGVSLGPHLAPLFPVLLFREKRYLERYIQRHGSRACNPPGNSPVRVGREILPLHMHAAVVITHIRQRAVKVETPFVVRDIPAGIRETYDYVGEARKAAEPVRILQGVFRNLYPFVFHTAENIPADMGTAYGH